MHISLDAALQRQPLLSTVGDKLLPSFPGAAAAYSLRALNGDANDVVKVRRDADNEDRDFTAEGVSLELEDWVNGKQETVLPADGIPDPSLVTSFTASGAGNVNLNGTFTLNQFGWQRPNADGYIRYFKSGTQWFYRDYDGEEGSNSVISNDDVAYPWLIENWEISNPPTLGTFRTSEGVVSFGEAAAAYSLRKVRSAYTGDAVRIRRESDYVEVDVAFDSNDEVSTSSAITNVTESPDQGDTTATTLGDFLTESVNVYTQTSDLSVLAGSGTQYEFPSNSAPNTIGQTYEISFEAKRNSGGSGTHGDVRLRTTSTWSYTVVSISDNLTAQTNRFKLNTTSESYQTYTVTVTTNTGSSESPLRIQNFDTNDDYTVRNAVINVVGHKATVHTWYDQSGNGKDATQDTAGSQPKIADAGRLVAGGIDFDGGDDFFNVSGIDESQPITGFIQLQPDATTDAANEVLDGTIVNTNRILLDASSGNWRLFAGSVLTGASVSTSSSLLYFLANSTSSEFGLNGATALTGDAGTNSGWADGLTIGASISGDFYNGKIGEIILYPSDQSDNRFKIESNINNHYGLYTAAEDGFVNTWYDQSGNGNDATASADTNEPKIVNAGSYLEKLDFDNSNDFLTTTNQFSFGNGARSIFTVCAPDSIGANTDGILQLSIQSTGTGQGWLVTPELAIRTNIRTWISSSPATLSEDNLISSIYTSGNLHPGASMYLNGAEVTRTSGTDGSINTVTSEIRIGAGSNGSAPFDGGISEIIIYASDQSANRPAIEDNINNHYELYS